MTSKRQSGYRHANERTEENDIVRALPLIILNDDRRDRQRKRGREEEVDKKSERRDPNFLPDSEPDRARVRYQ